MRVKEISVQGFKSFAKKTSFSFSERVTGIVGPNGSGKSNIAEAIRFVLGEQSMKSLRGKRGEDLIWSGSSLVPRAGRASVSLTFDNADRFLDVDFDEVRIERSVSRDGMNEYRINGSPVRLKDLLETLARANIGPTGHHIISQGEADKILSATSVARREMLEDALGLKVFQFKKEESIRKLEKTEENLRHIEALRREVAPHLRFLKRQVEKIERLAQVKKDAEKRFSLYFAREEAYVKREKALLKEKREKCRVALSATQERIAFIKKGLSSPALEGGREGERKKEAYLLSVRRKKESALQEIARIDGRFSALKGEGTSPFVSRQAVADLISSLEKSLPPADADRDTLFSFITSTLQKIKSLVHKEVLFSNDIEKLTEERSAIVASLSTYEQEEERCLKEIRDMRDAYETAREQERETEREIFSLTATMREEEYHMRSAEEETRRLQLEEDELKREMAESAVLIGREVLHYEVESPVSREEQESEKRELQKIKLRLEEAGAAGGEEIKKEYEEVALRESHFEKEIADLTASKERLRALIAELEGEVRTRFKNGLDAINKEFTRFFSLMFDGGSATLSLTKEPVGRARSVREEEGEGEEREYVEGVDISLSIPRKKITSLSMLSGGERALTSIALIFAMSSVTPPPFVVLDETDAALDEANSRRYGDMVEALSAQSQLIIITHNRETMSRAGVLYGVTMGGEGVSRVLSVKFDEAVRVAK